MPSPIPFKRYAFAVLTVCLMQNSLAQAAFIGFQPDSILAGTGDSISLDLVIGDLGSFGPDSLGSFDISIGFDATALSFASYNLGGFLGDVNLFETVDASTGDSGGAVNVAEVSLLSVINLDALQPDEFTLATLNFNVVSLAAGAVTQLSVLSDPVLGDAFGSPLALTDIGSASIEGKASPVPIPGTLFLLTASLFVGLTLKRRKSI